MKREKVKTDDTMIEMGGGLYSYEFEQPTEDDFIVIADGGTNLLSGERYKKAYINNINSTNE